MDRRLPDTPWHVGYTKKDEDDPRRHKARCIHNVDGECRSTRSNYYKETCGGSSHCDEYSETAEDYKKLLEERKTADEIERDNIEKYKASLEPKKRKLARTENALSHKPTSDLRRCLVCDEGLRKVKYSLKKCSYCGMYYVDIQESTMSEILDIIKADEVFLMNIPKQEVQNTGSIISVHRVCKYINKKNKCTNVQAKKCGKRCSENGCEYYEQ